MLTRQQLYALYWEGPDAVARLVQQLYDYLSASELPLSAISDRPLAPGARLTASSGRASGVSGRNWAASAATTTRSSAARPNSAP